MADIFGVACTFVRGRPRELTDRVQTFQLPGVNGYGVQILGKGDADFVFSAELLALQEAVETWFQELSAKKGLLGTIVDDWGTSHTNLLITRLSQPSKSVAVFTGIDTLGIIRVEGVKRS